MQSEIKQCQNCKNSFIIEPEDFDFYKKIDVPPPTFCSECRFKRRGLFRNEMILYNNKCAFCDKSVITMYNPKRSYVIYCNDCWISDKWDPYSYFIDYDPSKPFFKQLKELADKVPKSATYVSVSTGVNINSEYTNFAGGNKDGYLIFNSGPNNENCAYSRGLIGSCDAFDVYYADEVQNTYESVSVHKSADISWGQNLSNCINCQFVLNCSGCQNCFGCVNLLYKSYYFFNEQLDKDEWRRRVFEISGSYIKTEEMKRKFLDFSLKFPRRSSNNLKVANCVGDYIFESKNCQNCFELSFCEDMKYSHSVKRARDCADMIGHCRNSELLFNGVAVGAGARKVTCSWGVESSQDIEYCFAVRQSQHCIGCVGIKNGNFVILNKKYNKDEYYKIKDNIIKELIGKNIYGDFFPPELSFFAYNETINEVEFPLTKEEALKQGFRWEDDIQITTGKETIKTKEIPDYIKEVDDSILNEILLCNICQRNYKIIESELQFYRKMVLPIPRKCFYCRHRDRVKRRGSFKFFDRICDNCNKSIKTSYSPDRPEIVYCEECYQKEVF